MNARSFPNCISAGVCSLSLAICSLLLPVGLENEKNHNVMVAGVILLVFALGPW